MLVQKVSYPFAGNHLRSDCPERIETDQSVYPPHPVINNPSGYAGAFYFLSMVLRSIPLGIAYAIWSGAGIVLVALVGWLVFKQHLDLPAIIGICMILGGVVVINLFSESAGH